MNFLGVYGARQKLLRFAFGVFVVALAVVARILLRKQLGSELAFVTFYPAVFLAAVVGGLWPGVLATVLAAAAADYLVILPVGSLLIAKTSDFVGMGVFLATGSSISVLGETLQRTQKLAAESNEQLKVEVQERKHAEESNALLASIVSSSEVAIVSETLEGIVTSWNHGAQRLFGYTPEQAIGRNVGIIIPPEHAFEEADIHDSLRKGELVDHFETVRVHQDGRPIQVSLTVSPVRCANGAVVGGSKILRDITDRKRAEEQFQMVVESAPTAMVMVNQTGRITLVNAQTEQLFGYSRRELLGQPVELLMPERFRGSHPGHLNAFYTKPEAYSPSARSAALGHDLYARRKDGSEFPVDIGLNPIPTKQELLVLSTIVDLTERRVEEERIRRFNEMLELQVAARTTQLRNANKELEAFAYAASHDLKAPLRVIDNCSRWIEEDLQQYLSGDTRENMNMMRSRIKRMQKLLDDLLEYARIGQTTDTKYNETIAGDELMHNVLELLAPDGFTVTVSPGFARIQVRTMPLQQILMNLISNAMKHHDKKQGCIDVTVEDRGALYAFAVRDDGPGIPSRFHQEIFKMFQTLKSKDQVDGSGMGLAMVRKHVELFGGEIDVESSEGKGSTFRFTLPKQPTPVADHSADL